jgi:hypothetical protein
LGVGLVQLGAFRYGVAQHQAGIAGKINIDHFDVGIDEPDVVLPRQFTTNTTVAAFIMDTLQLLEVPVRSPQTGIRLSRSWRGLLLLAAALKQVVKHREDFAAVADLAHRQRRSIGAQTLIQRPK